LNLGYSGFSISRICELKVGIVKSSIKNDAAF
jgi:hypothetical protein